VSMRFEDPAADFIPAVERVFGASPRVLDGSRAVLLGEVKLQHRLGMVEVELDIEEALREAKAKLDELD
jgi:hypothetical protein